MKVKSYLLGIENDSSPGPGPVQLSQAELQAHCLLTHEIVRSSKQNCFYLLALFLTPIYFSKLLKLSKTTKLEDGGRKMGPLEMISWYKYGLPLLGWPPQTAIHKQNNLEGTAS